MEGGGGGIPQSLYDTMVPDYLNKPVAQMNVRDFIGLLQPLERKLDTLEYSANSRINGLEKQNEVLLNELNSQKKKSDVLSGIVVDMQRALNDLDAKDRSANIIVSGLSELDINMPDGQILRSDQEKMSFILQSIGIRDEIISKDDLQNCQFNRIGKKVDDRSRMLKINLHDNTIREAIMKNAPTLKTLQVNI